MADNPYKNVRASGLSRSARSAKAQAIREGKAEWDRNERARLEGLLSEANAVVSDFNAKLAAGIRHECLMASPLLRAALISKQHWMHVHCPGCDSVKAIDLRVVPRPPETALIAIAAKLRCERCRRQAPAPAIVRLAKRHDG